MDLNAAVKKHGGTLVGASGDGLMIDGKAYDHRSKWDDADDADAFLEDVEAAAADGTFVKGVYTMWFTLPKRGGVLGRP